MEFEELRAGLPLKPVRSSFAATTWSCRRAPARPRVQNSSIPGQTRSPPACPVHTALSRLSAFNLGKTSIQKHSQRTARLLSQDALELAFVEPDPFTTSTAIYHESQDLVFLKFS